MSLSLPASFRRQQLVLDLSSLRDRCPEGLYLSLTPGDASLWVAVLFVRNGPYEGAILRFHLSFPDTYPDSPPLITFSSDVFHPLVVPLTTYTFSTNAADASTTVSASSEDRLPPGAFTLRHGFPQWFYPRPSNDDGVTSESTAPDTARPSTPRGAAAEVGSGSEQGSSMKANVDRGDLILKVLRHIQNAFESEEFLDRIPLNAVGDPSAWHAWRAYRGLAHQPENSNSADRSASQAAPSSPKNAGEWKWDGVWESRVRNGIEASISEAALFSSTSGSMRAGSVPMESTAMDPRQKWLAAADRQFRFSKLSHERYEELKAQMIISQTELPTS